MQKIYLQTNAKICFEIRYMNILMKYFNILKFIQKKFLVLYLASRAKCSQEQSKWNIDQLK